MEPLNFTPPRMYVLDKVWQNPQTARRAERLAAAWPGVDVRTFSYDNLPGIIVDEGWNHSPNMGTLDTVLPPIPILGMYRFDKDAVARDSARMREAFNGDGHFPFETVAGGGAFKFFYSKIDGFECDSLHDLRPNPQHVCRPQWRIQQGRGCPHQCAYCSLGKYLITNVNTEEYIERLGDLLAQNPWQRTWLYDDIMDVPTLEPYIDTLPPLMRFFESTGDRYLIIHTKTDRVDALIEAGAPRNTIVAWSLSGPTQSRQLEREAGTTESRIEAARRCQEAGIQIRYKFKPIIPVKSWREDAEYTIDLALRATRPDNLSMTALMWMSIDTVKRCIPADMLDQGFLRAAEAAVDEMKGQRVGPFPHEVREEIYRHYLATVRAKDADIPLIISTESLDMWKSLGPDLGYSPADYPCGCGAGATPGKQRLETSPWRDARDARAWDGKPAMG